MSVPIGLNGTGIFYENYNAVYPEAKLYQDVFKRHGAANQAFHRDYHLSLKKLEKTRARVVVNRGGTRSSKTHSILQIWEFLASTNERLNILVTRYELPELRLSALKDFEDYLDNIDRYSGRQLYDKYDNFPQVDPEKDSKPIRDFWSFNKTDLIFTHKITGSKIYFRACRDEQKVRGVKWDYAQITEANEVPFSVFRQIMLRLKKVIVLDFNPSDENVWINREIEQKRDDFKLIQSSYRDNPYLDKTIIKEIELLKTQDPDYFHIFGEGNYGVVQGKIFDYEVVSIEEFFNTPFYDEVYGLDFGFKNPSALMHIRLVSETKVLINEVFNARSLFTSDMHELMVDYGHIDASSVIYADPNNPTAIQELMNYGWNMQLAQKSVEDGIGFIKRNMAMGLTNTSTESKKQFDSYHFMKDRNGNYFDKPVKINDHAPDAARYGIYTGFSPLFNT